VNESTAAGGTSLTLRADVAHESEVTHCVQQGLPDPKQNTWVRDRPDHYPHSALGSNPLIEPATRLNHLYCETGDHPDAETACGATGLAVAQRADLFVADGNLNRILCLTSLSEVLSWRVFSRRAFCTGPSSLSLSSLVVRGEDQETLSDRCASIAASLRRIGLPLERYL
jgi:hypothetical protein